MGLDMYLYAEADLSGYSHRTDREQEQYNEIISTLGAHGIASDDSKWATVRITVGYWRKANAIHNWFVNNVQGGNDDCDKYIVTRDDLLKLKECCLTVLGNRELAAEMLPTAAGFFFGGTEFDNYYYEELETTVKLIHKLLKETPDSWGFYYQSSW